MNLQDLKTKQFLNVIFKIAESKKGEDSDVIYRVLDDITALMYDAMFSEKTILKTCELAEAYMMNQIDCLRFMNFLDSLVLPRKKKSIPKKTGIECYHKGEKAMIVKILANGFVRIKSKKGLSLAYIDDLFINGKGASDLIDAFEPKEEIASKEGTIMYHDILGEVLIQGETRDEFGNKVYQIEPLFILGEADYEVGTEEVPDFYEVDDDEVGQEQRFKGRKLQYAYDCELVHPSHIIKTKPLVESLFLIEDLDEDFTLEKDISSTKVLCRGLDTKRYVSAHKEYVKNMSSGITYSSSKLSNFINKARESANLSSLYKHADIDKATKEIASLGLDNFEFKKLKDKIQMTIESKGNKWSFEITMNGELIKSFPMAESAEKAFKNFALCIFR